MSIGGRGYEIQGNGIAMVVLSTIATVLRIYCRGWVTKSFALEDWLAIAAQVSTISRDTVRFSSHFAKVRLDPIHCLLHI